ncbi:baseplate assembly protein [Agarilytica rhodophyticola]|uniref:baseplate assembly protein n=1 Tax=Agarilytica rhodophyticola TaxID=1737490 RepID=UPI000B34140A|nr:baseplate J/gp47 family protein [Agarilytica rhodophyticola]
MTSFSAIDLEKLPAPNIVEALDFETILESMLNDLRERAPELTVNVESDPVYKILEVAAYREVLLRSRVNDACRAVMLAYATDDDLENLAVFFDVERQLVHPGDPTTIPPTLPVFELDSRLRTRTQLSLEGHSTAGPIGSYTFHALAADPRVKDVDIASPTPGEVVVTVLSTENIGVPTSEVLMLVESQLNSEDVRPLTDHVTMQAATIVRYNVVAELILFSGPDSTVVSDAANKALNTYIEAQHQLGRDITLSGIYSALHQPGVQRVNLVEPTSDIVVQSHQAPWPDSIEITFGGRDN